MSGLFTSLVNTTRALDAQRLGMDVERATYDLAGARDALVRARVVIHAFSPERFAEVIAEDTGTDDERALLLGSALAGMAQVAARHWLAATTDGHPIGCARLLEDRIGRLAVLPEYRRQGVGSALMRRIIRGSH